MSGGGDLAIIAGEGMLPGLLAAAARPARVLALEGFDCGVEGAESFGIETLGETLAALCGAGVRRVVFAGAIRRPALDPARLGPLTRPLLPALARAMGAGDDAALRAVIGIFEAAGLAVIGADAAAPDLVPGPGLLAGALPEGAEADAARAAAIVAALGAADVGQGAVVAGGLCLATEALPGTDAMLAFAGAHRGLARTPGLLYKAPKPGQDRRVDLPAIGPETVRGAAAAGLAGVAWEAGGALLLGRDATIAEARRHGLFLWSRAR